MSVDYPTNKMPEVVVDRIKNDSAPWRNKNVLHWFRGQNVSRSDVSKRLGCTPSTIRKYARKFGIEFRLEDKDTKWMLGGYRSAVYMLRLENNNYYVGGSRKVSERLEEHFNGEGIPWTQEYNPVQIMDIKRLPDASWEDVEQREQAITLKYMKRFGWESVRGSKWVEIDLKRPPIELWPYYDDWPKREWLSIEEERKWFGDSRKYQERMDDLAEIAQSI